MAVCPVDCFYRTDEGVVLHDKDLCIGCGYCFYACPFGAPQFPRHGAFGLRGKMDKCTFCAGGPEAERLARRSSRSTAATAWPKASCRRAPRCARPRRCSAATATWSPTSSATACCTRGKGSEVWGWGTAYGKPTQAQHATPAKPRRTSHERPLVIGARRRRGCCSRCVREAADRSTAMRKRPTRRPGQGDASSRSRRAGWKAGDKASWEQQMRRRAPRARTTIRATASKAGLKACAARER